MPGRSLRSEFTAAAASAARAQRQFAASFERGKWHTYKGRPATPQKSPPPPAKKAPEPAPGAPKPEEPKPAQKPEKGH